MTRISKNQVLHMSKLANIPIKENEVEGFAEGFSKTIEAVDRLFDVDTDGVEPTHQVTGLENVLREDTINEKKTLSQEEALKNAKDKHNGYFVVDQILAED